MREISNLQRKPDAEVLTHVMIGGGCSQLKIMQSEKNQEAYSTVSAGQTKKAWGRLICIILLSLIGISCSDHQPRLNRKSAVNEPDRQFERIVCMSPSAVEIVFALGKGERVVGVSDYTGFPPEAVDLPRCGGHFNPNFEIILALRPDLIISHGKNEKMKSFAAGYGITALFLQIDNLQSIYASIKEVAAILNCEPNAQSMIEEMKNNLDRLKRKSDSERPLNTLLVVGRDPASLREITVVGGGGFLHEMLEIAGGRNIMADSEREYTNVSKEVIARRAPEVIIELHGEGMMESDQLRKYLRPWQEMNSLPAVRNDRVYVLEETFAMLPGPRSAKAAERMADFLQQARKDSRP